MKLYRSALVAAFMLTVAAATRDEAAPPLKCPSGTPDLFHDAPEPAHVLNGGAVSGELAWQLDPATVETIEVVCAIDLHRVFGVKARRTGIVIHTAPGPHSELKASLDSIAILQTTHFEKHGAFASTLTELSWGDPSGLITVELAVTDSGNRWAATGRHRHLIGRSFAVSVSAPSSGASVGSTRTLPSP